MHVDSAQASGVAYHDRKAIVTKTAAPLYVRWLGKIYMRWRLHSHRTTNCYAWSPFWLCLLLRCGQSFVWSRWPCHAQRQATKWERLELNLGHSAACWKESCCGGIKLAGTHVKKMLSGLFYQFDLELKATSTDSTVENKGSTLTEIERTN